MNKIILIILCFISINAFSQEKCNCEQVLEYVSKEIEVNSASFAHQVKEYNREKEYLKHKKQIIQIAQKLDTNKECIGLTQYYLSFLRDAHQRLHLNDNYFPSETEDSIKMMEFVGKTVANFPLKQIENDGLLGNWIDEKGTFEIQIQKNDKNGRKYIGVLTKPYKRYAHKGDLKIEFYENYNGELVANYWSFGQTPTTYKINFDNEKLVIGRNLKFYRNKPITDKKHTNSYSLPDSTYFMALSNKTNYLRIHSFSYPQKELIDSLIMANHDELIGKENLIIDVRNNGGGSDLCYQSLLPYVMDSLNYKQPYTGSVWVSEDNFIVYDNERYLYGVETKQDSLDADVEIEDLKKHIGSFEPSQIITSSLNVVYKKPKNIVIVTNRRDASSTEGFVLTAKQSNKVKTYGENTMGAISYGEWRELEISGLPAWISMTNKKMTFCDGSDFEMIGIKPDFNLESINESKWITQIMKEMEK